MVGQYREKEAWKKDVFLHVFFHASVRLVGVVIRVCQRPPGPPRRHVKRMNRNGFSADGSQDGGERGERTRVVARHEGGGPSEQAIVVEHVSRLGAVPVATGEDSACRPSPYRHWAPMRRWPDRYEASRRSSAPRDTGPLRRAAPVPCEAGTDEPHRLRTGRRSAGNANPARRTSRT